MNLISSMLTSASLLPIPHTIAVISAMAFSSSSSSGSLKNPNFKVEEEEEKLRLVLKYHNQTKHSFTGYARGPRGLDWANQPNPFRNLIVVFIMHTREWLCCLTSMKLILPSLMSS